jgi:hypothetical protein
MNLIPQFNADLDTNLFCLTPTIFCMCGEHEDGAEAGFMLGLTWFGFTIGLVWS